MSATASKDYGEYCFKVYLLAAACTSVFVVGLWLHAGANVLLAPLAMNIAIEFTACALLYWELMPVADVMLGAIVAINISTEALIIVSGNIRSPFAFAVCTIPTFSVLVIPNKRVRVVATCTLILRIISAVVGDLIVEPHIFDETTSDSIKHTFAITIILFTFFAIERFLESLQQQKIATDNFLSVVSHELRTPLAAIIGLRELIDEAKSETERKALLDAISSNAECLTSTVDTILLLTKVRTSRDELKPTMRRISTSVALEEEGAACDTVLAKACSVCCDSKLLGENVQLLSECAAAKVIGNYDAWTMHLQQMLLIALTNSCKYTSEGRILVRADVFDRNSMSTSGNEASDKAGSSVLRGAPWATHLLRIDIEDTGVGIAAENRERVFEPFFREGHSGTSGVGLGLPLMRSMLESLMSGSVVVGEPKRVGGGAGGPGTRITVLLPCIGARESEEMIRVDHTAKVPSLSTRLRTESHAERRSRSNSRRESGAFTIEHADTNASSAHKLVLVADDSEILRRIAQRKLEKAGASVLLAADGNSALESAIARYSDLSLIVLDESMPGMTGLEVAKALQERTATFSQKVPVIIYSAHNPVDIGLMSKEDDGNMERFCRRMGIDAWLVKAMKRNADVWSSIAQWLQ